MAVKHGMNRKTGCRCEKWRDNNMYLYRAIGANTLMPLKKLETSRPKNTKLISYDISTPDFRKIGTLDIGKNMLMRRRTILTLHIRKALIMLIQFLQNTELETMRKCMSGKQKTRG